MVYDLLELTRSVLAPLHLVADSTRWTLQSPLSPLYYHPLANAAAANSELFSRLTRTYHKPEFDIRQSVVREQPVAVQQHVVDERPFCRLLHFRKEVADPGPRLLIVAPLSGHYATLLRDTVSTMLTGHDVFITDWQSACAVPVAAGPFDLSDYTGYIQHYIQLLGPDLHVMAVCQPTVPVLSAVSLLAQRGEPTPASMILIAGPIDPRENPTAVDRYATSTSIEWFTRHVICRVPLNHAGRFRRVYPGYLQLTGFVSMNPGLHAEAYMAFYNDMLEGDLEGADAHRKFYNDYNAVLDIPAEFYLETIRTVFQTFDLPLGRMALCGTLVEPAAINHTALLTIEGERDDITGRGQTHAAQALCTGLPGRLKVAATVAGVGHYGVFSGSKFRAHVAPRIAEFIRKHPAASRAVR